jgi:hypothetical protein
MKMDNSNKELIQGPVFPSMENTIWACNTDDEYGGAHCYEFKNCLGFENGETKYDESKSVIQFIKKNADGTVIPGLQNEQIVIAMIDRLKKLDAKFPHPENKVQLECLEGYLSACKRRVEERMGRGVMGNLTK